MAKKTRVAVALSGGIDSSITAALLKKDGFDVKAVFLKLFDSPKFRKAEKQAKKIAQVLDIPFFKFDFKKEFKKEVIDYFLKEYQAGRTPNPCVICNKEIKFGSLLKKLSELNSDYLATGHYACIKKGNTGYELLEAKDKTKDQTYFLYNLKQKDLKKVLFPIGNYLKEDIRKMAKEFNIASMVAPESKNICFINGITKNYLKKHLNLKPGLILDKKGIKIGEHKGLPLYTIGQRKEIKVSGFFPYYVLKLDFKNNALIVTNNERDLYKKELIVEKVNWISRKKPKLSTRIKAKIRYLHPASFVKIVSKPRDEYLVKFTYAQRAITSGQSIVFYDKKNVLGGGIIK